LSIEAVAVRGTRSHAQLPLILLGLLAVISALTLWAPPAGRFSWVLEAGPGLLMIAVFGALYRRFPLTHLVYVGMFVHVLILIYGGVYTYAHTPLGDWARDTFHLSRNHYDRIGHLALGFFPGLTIREVLLRRTPLVRGGWLTFLVLSVVLAIGAFWEILEWWATLVLAADTGQAFLGSQGDVWDAQWDMLLALVGAAISLPLLGKIHDRQLVSLGVFAPEVNKQVA
jgi:putative membrane protein